MILSTMINAPWLEAAEKAAEAAAEQPNEPMATWAAVVLMFCMLALVGCVIFLIRNEWVFRKRTAITQACYRNAIADIDAGRYEGEPYRRWKPQETMPTYNQMVYRFWVWDVKKFVRSEYHKELGL
jgi:hypothetical protein